MKFVTRLLAVCVLTGLSTAAVAQTCLTQPLSGGGYANGFQVTFRNSADGDLLDYGIILQDAKRRECSQAARDALLLKVTNTLTNGTNRGHPHVAGLVLGPYQSWMEGGTVGVALAAALAIGGHGDLSGALDTKLQQMITYYNTNPTSISYYRYGINTNCGVGRKWKGNLGDSDTCMDDHAIGAMGHAWAAAYQHLRNNIGSRDTHRAKAKAAIDDAFRLTETNQLDSICLHDPTQTMAAGGRGPCNVTSTTGLATLLTRTTSPGYTFALNRGQNQVYGFGLLASISAAALGLEISESPWTPTADQKLFMQALLEEAQSKAQPSTGDYFNGHLGGTANCAIWDAVGSSVVNNNVNPCADTMHRPRMYPLVSAVSGGPSATFFNKYDSAYTPKTSVTDHYTGATVNSAFQFNRFSFSDFVVNPATDGSKPHWGRAIWYGNLAYYWHTPVANYNNLDMIAPAAGELRPRMLGKLDDNDPIGHFDGISPTGVATGWACDRDWPSRSSWVELYWDSSTPSFSTYIGSYPANVSNESAVTTACNGGLAHRFSVQLPGSASNRAVYIHAADVTWRGATLLSASACTGGVCRW